MMFSAYPLSPEKTGCYPYTLLIYTLLMTRQDQACNLDSISPVLFPV